MFTTHNEIYVFFGIILGMLIMFSLLISLSFTSASKQISCITSVTQTDCKIDSFSNDLDNFREGKMFDEQKFVYDYGEGYYDELNNALNP